jgi:hypothetical protein
MTIRYIHRLIEEYLNEYKCDEYNLINSSVPMNINYIHWLRGTDEHNYLYYVLVSSRGNTPRPRGFYIPRLTDEYTGRVVFIYVG